MHVQRFSEVLDQLRWPFCPLLPKIITLDFLNANFQFGDCQNVRYSSESIISESGTFKNLSMWNGGKMSVDRRILEQMTAKILEEEERIYNYTVCIK